MPRLIGRREPGFGPSLITPKRPNLALIALRWRNELVLAVAALSGIGAAVAWAGLERTLLCTVGLGAAIGGACTRPEVRRLVVARFWLFATPHRVRTCFALAWIYNGRGQIPAVLRATAIPQGECVLVWLRAGISFADIESATGLLAAACFATEVIAIRDPRYGHRVYLDVIRWPERHGGASAGPTPWEPDALGGPDSGPRGRGIQDPPSDDQSDAA